MRALQSLADLRRFVRRTPLPNQSAGTGATGSAHSAQSPRLGDLPQPLWLWFPVASIAVLFAVRLLFGADTYKDWMGREQGVVENATVVILVAAIAAGVLAFRRRRSLPSVWLGGWIALLTAGCVYFAVEELSWGQHWFGWETPASIGAINDQQETNIHNISSWFDQKPRLILELGTLICGVVFPLWALRKGFSPDPGRDWRYWFWPTLACFPAAVLAILIRLPSRWHSWFDWPKPPPFDIRLSEVQEYFFAVILLFYLWSIHVRLREFEKRGRTGRRAAPASERGRAAGARLPD